RNGFLKSAKVWVDVVIYITDSILIDGRSQRIGKKEDLSTWGSITVQFKNPIWRRSFVIPRFA
ncbi:MAG: hypothetical protein L0Y56_20775, partial [Nitrospira sp.]|nr:hypothetical protein [Nitrospira sp.]